MKVSAMFGVRRSLATPAGMPPLTWAIIALTFGALAGGLTTAIWVFIAALLEHWGAVGVIMGLLVALYGTVIWWLGLTCLGGPVWWALHRSGVRALAPAVLLGAFTIGGLFFAWGRNLAFLGVGAFEGGLVAWVIWRIAYGRAMP